MLSVANILYFALFVRIYLYIRFRLSPWRRARPGPAAPGSQDVPLIHLSHPHTHSAHSDTASPGWSEAYTDSITRSYAHGTSLHRAPSLISDLIATAGKSNVQRGADVTGVAFHSGIQYSDSEDARCGEERRGAARRRPGHRLGHGLGKHSLNPSAANCNCIGSEAVTSGIASAAGARDFCRF